MQNKKGYYINIYNSKIIIPEDKFELHTKVANIFLIKKLVCNSNLDSLWCYNESNLIELKLNKKLESLWCYESNLKELKLNNNLNTLYCDINTKLLNIPKNCEIHIYE